jgi:hypothetical protein
MIQGRKDLVSKKMAEKTLEIIRNKAKNESPMRGSNPQPCSWPMYRYPHRALARCGDTDTLARAIKKQTTAPLQAETKEQR